MHIAYLPTVLGTVPKTDLMSCCPGSIQNCPGNYSRGVHNYTKWVRSSEPLPKKWASKWQPWWSRNCWVFFTCGKYL